MQVLRVNWGRVGASLLMKFGEFLESNLYPEWRFYYVDYEGLKTMLKGRNGEDSGAGGFSEKDEANFVEALEREMEKV